MKAKFTALALAVAGLALSTSVGATSATSTFQVKLTVQSSCQFNSTPISNIELGEKPVNTKNVEGTTEVRVQCTKGSVANVKLISTDWKLKDTSGGTISYKLYGADNQEWNQTNGRAYTNTSSGSEQVFQIKAKVADVGDKSGVFADTVTVSVDF
ncbi:MAG: spore coat protein U domain-containing protein [Burkholderiaceae bacterium]